MAQMLSNSPARKVLSGSAGGAIATLIIYCLDTYVLAEPLPTAVAAAVTTLVVFTFGYIMPPSDQDTITSKRTA